MTINRISEYFRIIIWLQISPPASINSIGSCTEWGLLAAGTAHGLIIFDCAQATVIFTKCTLNAQGTFCPFGLEETE